MNKEYIYIEGKAIIKDENGNQNPVDYYDNLDEVLVQENVVETMEDKISFLEHESSEYQKNSKMHYIPFVLPTAALATIVALPFFLNWIGAGNMLVVDTVLGSMNLSQFFSYLFSVIYLPPAGIIEFNLYREHKKRLKRENGVNSELEFLKKQLVEEKEILEELKKDKKKTEDCKVFEIVKVDDSQSVGILEDWSELYYDLGYNAKEYYSDYKKGKLNSKLEEYYTDEGIEAAKKYLEEKGPVLAKKKTR